MTTKEATKKFGISEREIRKLASAGKIKNAKKVNEVYIIPDDIPIIITDKMARAFLLTILKLKNNPHLVLSTREIEDKKICRAWYDYMLEQELVGDCKFSSDPQKLLRRMQLTEKGIEQVVGKKELLHINSIQLSPTFNFSNVTLNA